MYGAKWCEAHRVNLIWRKLYRNSRNQLLVDSERVIHWKIKSN